MTPDGKPVGEVNVARLALDPVVLDQIQVMGIAVT